MGKEDGHGWGGDFVVGSGILGRDDWGMWKRVFWAVLGVMILVLVVRVAWPSRSDEPMYKGKTVHEWLRELEGEHLHGDPHADPNTPEFAFREMGTNAIPTLITIIKTHRPAQRRLIEFAGQLHLPAVPWTEEMYRDSAVQAFGFMGHIADPAIPALQEIAQNNPRPEIRAAAAQAIMGIQQDVMGRRF